MPGLAQRAAIVTLARFASIGLMLLSPILLVRVLSVEEFGLYREFLVYATILQAIAAFDIGDSLYYFVPAHPERTWRSVRQSVALTAVTSLGAVALIIGIDAAFGIVGQWLLPLSTYVLLLVNCDFWEPFLIATGRTLWMLAYATSRLIARLAVVMVTAVITRDVETIIWSLVAFEGVRFAASVIVWRVMDRSPSEPPAGPWKSMVRFCVPTGGAVALSMVNKNVGPVVIANILGAVSLAHYTIGTYVDPIVRTVRNSLSAVLLPEMVKRQSESLYLWRRSIVVNLILLLPLAVVMARYADPIVVTLFGANYQPAVVVTQIYMLMVVRECFDFSPPLRAIGKTGPLLYGNAASLIVTMAALFVLLPIAGIIGAVGAVVISRIAEAIYLGWHVKRLHGVKDLIPWRALSKIAAAASASAPLLLFHIGDGLAGLIAVTAALITYGVTFFAMLLFLGLDEAKMLAAKLKSRLLIPTRSRA